MLQTLTIRNIALIENLTIDFGPGLHALTGETGAGKSIIVDAVNLVLGARSDRSLIRTGTEKASVEAVFGEEASAGAAAWLREKEIDPEDGPVILYREITVTGRSICRICGVPVPLSTLRELADQLMDIHGQHENRFLMDSRFHLQLLDGAGDEAHQESLRQAAEAAEAFLRCHRRYAALVRENQQRQARRAELEKALAELEKARLKPGEEETLREERERSRHAGRIAEELRKAYEGISGGDPDPALSLLKPAADALENIAPYGETYRSLAQRVRSAYYELEECGHEIGGLLNTAAFDPARAERVENRLALIARLEQRFGEDIPAVLETGRQMKAELDALAEADVETGRLEKEDRLLLADYRAKARSLSEARVRLAARFEAGMEAQLKDLGMGSTVFKVDFAPRPARAVLPRVTGDDDVSFLISPNPGEPLKPLSRIASGGELSRLMLALKNMEAAHGGLDCMVFDEIDTGISGRVAQAVAEKMASISRERQVLCVTHLPQLAAMADTQLLVEKTVSDGRTGTHVRRLTEAERADEIARMLGGASGSDESAHDHAVHMLEAARELKSKAAFRSDCERQV